MVRYLDQLFERLAECGISHNISATLTLEPGWQPRIGPFRIPVLKQFWLKVADEIDVIVLVLPDDEITVYVPSHRSGGPWEDIEALIEYVQTRPGDAQARQQPPSTKFRHEFEKRYKIRPGFDSPRSRC